MRVKSLYPFVVDADRPFMADVEVELPSNLAGNTAYGGNTSLVTSKGDLFVSAASYEDGVYLIKKGESTYTQILGFTATMQKVFEIDGDNFIFVQNNKPPLKYTISTNTLKNMSQRVAYNAVVVNNTLELVANVASGNYTKQFISDTHFELYKDGVKIEDYAEDYEDVFDGKGDGMFDKQYILSETPYKDEGPVTTLDFRAFLKRAGEEEYTEIVNIAQTQFVYLISNNKPVIEFKGNSIPLVGDSVIIMYNIEHKISYSGDGRTITTHFNIEDGTHIFVKYTSNVSAGINLYFGDERVYNYDSSTDLFVYATYMVYKYNKQYDILEYIVSKQSSGAFQIENWYISYGDKVTVRNLNTNEVITKNALSMPVYDKYSNSVWFRSQYKDSSFSFGRISLDDMVFYPYLPGNVGGSDSFFFKIADYVYVITSNKFFKYDAETYEIYNDGEQLVDAPFDSCHCVLDTDDFFIVVCNTAEYIIPFYVDKSNGVITSGIVSDYIYQQNFKFAYDNIVGIGDRNGYLKIFTFIEQSYTIKSLSMSYSSTVKLVDNFIITSFNSSSTGYSYIYDKTTYDTLFRVDGGFTQLLETTNYYLLYSNHLQPQMFGIVYGRYTGLIQLNKTTGEVYEYDENVAFLPVVTKIEGDTIYIISSYKMRNMLKIDLTTHTVSISGNKLIGYADSTAGISIKYYNYLNIVMDMNSDRKMFIPTSIVATENYAQQATMSPPNTFIMDDRIMLFSQVDKILRIFYKKKND